MAPSILTKHMTLRTELPPSPEMEPGSKTKREKNSRIAVRQLTTSTSQIVNQDLTWSSKLSSPFCAVQQCKTSAIR